MTTRDRVRDREERDRRAQQAQARTNEYFVPKDGIDREVITADICRYLGNDALVRPGQYENPQTRQVQQGFFITAYRNLTTAMIADLKADSERWEQERRATQSRGQPSNVEYRASTTHQSRQYYGPTSETAQPAPLGYQQPSSTSTSTGQVYDSSAQGGYPQQSSYAQPPSAYQQSQGYAAVQDSSNYYMAGADMAIDRSSAGRVPVTTQSPIPRSNVQYATSSSTYPQQQDSRNMYSPYQQPGVAVSSAQYSQPQDAYYPSRGAYDSQDPYGERVYQDSSAYSQIPVTAAPAVAPAPANSSSRRSERESERERDRHGQRRRH
jgi:hypothetical protein